MSLKGARPQAVGRKIASVLVGLPGSRRAESSASHGSHCAAAAARLSSCCPAGVLVIPPENDTTCRPAQKLSDRLLERLFRSEAPRLARFLRRSVHNHDEVHDLVQETFANLAAARSLAVLRTPEAYLRSIARNLLYRRSRTHAAKAFAIHVPVDEALDVSISPEQEWMMEADDLMRRYQEALAELPERTREVFRLHRQEELAFPEIAERLGLTLRGVRYHMKKALLYLDHRLNAHD